MLLLLSLLLLFSCSVVSDSLPPHGLQHTRFPCPSPTPRTCSDSCPSSRWCPPNISSSLIPFSSCSQSFLSLESFPMSQLFPSDGQSIGAAASASVLPMTIQSCCPLLVWSPCCLKGSQESSSEPQFENINYLALSLLDSSTLTSIHDYQKNQALTIWTLSAKWCLCFLMLLFNFCPLLCPSLHEMFPWHLQFL